MRTPRSFLPLALAALLLPLTPARSEHRSSLGSDGASRASVAPQFDTALRDIDETNPQVVMVALTKPAGPGDTIFEQFPPGIPASLTIVHGWTSLRSGTPTTWVGETSSDVVEVPVNVSFDTELNTMLVTALSALSAITYELQVPLAPGSAFGTVLIGGIPEPIVEVPSLQGYFDAITGDPLLLEGVFDKINTSTADWANNVNVASLPVVTVDIDQTLTAANAGDHDTDGLAACARSAVNLGDNAAFMDFGVVGAGAAEGYSWVGTAFYVRGCNPTVSNEFAPGTFQIQGLDWEGCLYWAFYCVPAPVVTLICGVGMSSVRILWEVRVWTVSGGQISGGGTVLYDDERLNTTSAIPFICNHQSTASQNRATTEFSIHEGRVYMVRAIMLGRVGAALGGAATDFQDTADGGCTTERSDRAGLFYNSVFVNFNVTPMPDMHVAPADLSFSPNPIISGWPLDVSLTVHNYGTADALNVKTKFLADAEPMCKDLINPLPPTLSDCPEIPLLAYCGDQATVDFTWCSTGVGRRGINALVDLPLNQILEKSELNNAVTDSLDVEPPPAVASLLELDKSGSMDLLIYPGGPRNIDVERWIADRWIDLQSDPTAAAVFNFGANIVKELPLRYMTMPNKTAAHAAVQTLSGVNRGGTALFEALKEGLHALCCMSGTPVKSLVLFTDGADNVSPDPHQEAQDVIGTAACCQIPIIVFGVPPIGIATPVIEPGTVPGGAQGQHDILRRMARETGGGYYYIPVDAEMADVVPIVDEAYASLLAASDEGVVVSPVGQDEVAPGTEASFGGALNLGIVGDGWAAPIDLDVITPAGVAFSVMPPVEADDGIPLAGPVQLLDGNTRLHIPLGAVAPDPCTTRLTVGDESGILLQVDGGYPPGDIPLTVTDGFGAAPPAAASRTLSPPAISRTITIARAKLFTTGTPESEGSAPRVTRLLPVSPNPMGAQSVFRYELRAPAHVSLRIYNVRGGLVRTLANEDMPAGRHEVSWDRANDRGRRVRSGIYFVRLDADQVRDERRVTILQ